MMTHYINILPTLCMVHFFSTTGCYSAPPPSRNVAGHCFLPTTSLTNTSFLISTVANLYGWRLALDAATKLDSQTRDIVSRFRNAVLGTSQEQGRWVLCLTIVDEYYRLALDRLYIERHFSGQSRQEATRMIEEAGAEFQLLLDNADWMTPDDKAIAMKKAVGMEARVGYPDYLYNDTFISEKMEGIVAFEGRLFDTLAENKRVASVKKLEELRVTVDKSM